MREVYREQSCSWLIVASMMMMYALQALRKFVKIVKNVSGRYT